MARTRNTLTYASGGANWLSDRTVAETVLSNTVPGRSTWPGNGKLLHDGKLF